MIATVHYQFIYHLVHWKPYSFLPKILALVEISSWLIHMEMQLDTTADSLQASSTLVLAIACMQRYWKYSSTHLYLLNFALGPRGRVLNACHCQNLRQPKIPVSFLGIAN